MEDGETDRHSWMFRQCQLTLTGDRDEHDGQTFIYAELMSMYDNMRQTSCVLCQRKKISFLGPKAGVVIRAKTHNRMVGTKHSD